MKFERTSNPAFIAGGIAPFWICDTCAEKIEGLGDGNAIFLANGDRRNRTGAFLTIHKRRSCETEETRRYDWQPLEEFMYQLSRNAGFDWDEVEQRMIKRRRLGTL